MTYPTLRASLTQPQKPALREKHRLICEFNEKDFEKKVDFSLGRLTNTPLFSPDQVAEALLGFDSAWMLPYHTFSGFGRSFYVRRARESRRQSGIKINAELLARLPANNQLPPDRVKFNLFLQYKIPDFLSGHNSSQWVHWGVPYFRIALTLHQQIVLSRIDAVAAERAVAAYCTPAFLQKDFLHDAAETGTLIANSHFVRSSQLGGHHAYTYINARGMGKAHSDTSGVPSMDIESVLSGSSDFGEPVLFYQAARRAVDTINRCIEGSTFASIYYRTVSRSIDGDVDQNSFFVQMVRIYHFEQIFGVDVRFVIDSSSITTKKQEVASETT